MNLEQRILELSKKYKLSHIGSCLTSVGIIDEIYSIKKPDEKFVLSCGHAGLALYVVLEKYLGIDAEYLLLKHGVHPNRDEVINCSTGSLGQGLPIALGMALADRTKNVYCLISDGECAEGSVYEALNIKHRYGVYNLIVFCNYNGYGAYDRTDLFSIQRKLPEVNKLFDMSGHSFIKEYKQGAHYKIL
jgi:transketolase